MTFRDVYNTVNKQAAAMLTPEAQQAAIESTQTPPMDPSMGMPPQGAPMDPSMGGMPTDPNMMPPEVVGQPPMEDPQAMQD